jgi:hypothetical protein
MSQSAEVKLHELRSKTTRQLVSLISNNLDRGLEFARAMEAESADWDSAEEYAVQAERALADATSWMTLLKDVTPLERRLLESKTAQLRDALDRAGDSEIHVQAAC